MTSKKVIKDSINVLDCTYSTSVEGDAKKGFIIMLGMDDTIALLD